MQRVFVLVVVLWMFVGGFAAFQRGDFPDGNCSTAADTALAVVTGPLNYAVPEILKGTCSQPAQLTIREDRSPSLSPGLAPRLSRLPARSTVLTPDPCPLSRAREN